MGGGSLNLISSSSMTTNNPHDRLPTTNPASLGPTCIYPLKSSQDSKDHTLPETVGVWQTRPLLEHEANLCCCGHPKQPHIPHLRLKQKHILLISLCFFKKKISEFSIGWVQFWLWVLGSGYCGVSYAWQGPEGPGSVTNG